MSGEYLAVHFHWPAQLAAWLLTIYGLYLVTQVVRRIRISDRDVSAGWWLGGALCIGTGIWAASLLGLLSMQLPIRVGYVPSVVLASWLPGVVISGIVIWLMSNAVLPWRLRVLGGSVFAFGLCLMVLMDVSAMVLQPEVRWSARHVAMGLIAVLVGCALASLLIRKDLQWRPSLVRTMGVAVLVGSVLRLGQFWLVAAVVVPANAVCLSEKQLSGESLEWILTTTVLMLLVLLHMGTVLDARIRAKQEQLMLSLRQARTDLEKAAYLDALTGLPNRLGFEEHLKRVMQPPGDQALAHASVLRVSLDGLREFVDSYGHTLGDNIVRLMATRLRRHVRDQDVLARSDGDEFILLCTGLADAHAAAQLAQRLSDAIKEPCLVDDVDINLTCSVGVALYPDSQTVDQLLAHSMDAMQTARRAGGAVYCLYEHGMDRRGAEQVEMQRDLRHAIARNELLLHFQPKLRANGELAGVEALLRWNHPKRGMVSPAQFIPVAERFGLIGELGLWVLREACRHVRMWLDDGLEIPVAINISAHQLRQPNLEQCVRAALDDFGIPARMLIMEITESTAMDDIDASIRVFDMLAEIGVQLSIDDFGTGYSSLSYLRRLPAKQLKIDRAFVRDLESSLDAQAIVEAVVRLSHVLGLKVVAEGVETQAQADLLVQYACDELQGFLLAKPMPASALTAWVAQRPPQGLAANEANMAAQDAHQAHAGGVPAPGSMGGRVSAAVNA